MLNTKKKLGKENYIPSIFVTIKVQSLEGKVQSPCNQGNARYEIDKTEIRLDSKGACHQV